jgi:hypothetical protein
MLKHFIISQTTYFSRRQYLFLPNWSYHICERMNEMYLAQQIHSMTRLGTTQHGFSVELLSTK